MLALWTTFFQQQPPSCCAIIVRLPQRMFFWPVCTVSLWPSRIFLNSFSISTIERSSCSPVHHFCVLLSFLLQNGRGFPSCTVTVHPVGNHWHQCRHGIPGQTGGRQGFLADGCFCVTEHFMFCLSSLPLSRFVNETCQWS
jgi:hypothetical protein